MDSTPPLIQREEASVETDINADDNTDETVTTAIENVIREEITEPTSSEEKKCYNKTISSTSDDLCNACDESLETPDNFKSPTKNAILAKKRLQAYSSAKQGYTPHINNDVKEEKKSESVKIPSKKSKKDLNPDERAKAVIQEIEAIKKEEAEHHQYLKSRSRSSSAEKYRQFRRREIKSRNYRRNDNFKIPSRSATPTERDKRLDGDFKSKRSSPVKIPKYPKNWIEYKEFNFDVRKDRDLKTKIAKSRSSDRNGISRFFNFETPSSMLQTFHYNAVKGGIIRIPFQYIRLTTSKPPITYSVNFNQNKNCCITRKELFNMIPVNRRQMIETVYNKSVHFEEKVMKQRPWFSEQWKSGQINECRVSESSSVGLSFLQTYSDDEDETAVEDLVLESNVDDKEVKESSAAYQDMEEAFRIQRKEQLHLVEEEERVRSKKKKKRRISISELNQVEERIAKKGNKLKLKAKKEVTESEENNSTEEDDENEKKRKKKKKKRLSKLTKLKKEKRKAKKSKLKLKSKKLDRESKESSDWEENNKKKKKKREVEEKSNDLSKSKRNSRSNEEVNKIRRKSKEREEQKHSISKTDETFDKKTTKKNKKLTEKLTDKSKKKNHTTKEKSKDLNRKITKIVDIDELEVSKNSDKEHENEIIPKPIVIKTEKIDNEILTDDFQLILNIKKEPIDDVFKSGNTPSSGAWESDEDISIVRPSKQAVSWESDEEIFERGYNKPKITYDTPQSLEIPLNIKPFYNRRTLLSTGTDELSDMKTMVNSEQNKKETKWDKRPKKETELIQQERLKLEMQKKRIKELEVSTIKEVEMQLLERGMKRQFSPELEEDWLDNKSSKFQKIDNEEVDLSKVKTEKIDENSFESNESAVVNVSSSTEIQTSAALEDEYEEFMKAVTSTTKTKEKKKRKRASSSESSSSDDTNSTSSEKSEGQNVKKKFNIVSNLDDLKPKMPEVVSPPKPVPVPSPCLESQPQPGIAPLLPLSNLLPPSNIVDTSNFDIPVLSSLVLGQPPPPPPPSEKIPEHLDDEDSDCDKTKPFVFTSMVLPNKKIPLTPTKLKLDDESDEEKGRHEDLFESSVKNVDLAEKNEFKKVAEVTTEKTPEKSKRSKPSKEEDKKIKRRSDSSTSKSSRTRPKSPPSLRSKRENLRHLRRRSPRRSPMSRRRSPLSPRRRSSISPRRRYSISPPMKRRLRPSLSPRPKRSNLSISPDRISKSSKEILNSPMGSLKKSVADSTISDDLLMPNYAVDYDQSYNHIYNNCQHVDSPKRVPLDVRINEVLGLKDETEIHQQPINNYPSYNNYHEQYQNYNYNYNEFSHPPPPPPQPRANVVQVGNMLQIVPTEEFVSLPPPPPPPPTEQKIVQVGNMLQIVPGDLPPIKKEIEKPVVKEIVAVPSAEDVMKVKIAERRAEREKRRIEREKRRKEKEKRKNEKDKQKAMKLKMRAEHVIKKALQMEIEGDVPVDEEEELSDSFLSTTSCFDFIFKEAGKSILIKERSSHSSSGRKSVQFADGIRPGEGTSPSGGEELSSPPPDNRRFNKEKRYRKKKKIKVKVVKKRNKKRVVNELDDDDNLPPPPPPPGSPPPHLFPPRIKTHAINNVISSNYLPNVSLPPIPPPHPPLPNSNPVQVQPSSSPFPTTIYRTPPPIPMPMRPPPPMLRGHQGIHPPPHCLPPPGSPAPGHFFPVPEGHHHQLHHPEHHLIHPDRSPLYLHDQNHQQHPDSVHHQILDHHLH